jgi:PAS domain-containing protein
MDSLPSEALITNRRLAVMLMRPDGEIIYESPIARELLDRPRSSGRSLLPFLTVPTAWEDIVQRVERGEQIHDETVLLETVHGGSDLCYLTVFPQRSAAGGLESLLCVWGARMNALATVSSGENLTDYTRDLEELIEHRTYQNLLAAEQNEFAQQVLDVLGIGILILSSDGDVLYRNVSMCDEYGLRPAEYLQPNIRHFMPAAVAQSFQHVAETGLRTHHFTQDPGGSPVLVDILPLLRAGSVQRIVMQFVRPLTNAAERP